MPDLYSETLLHFMPRMEYLMDKFSKGFIPRYYLEFDDIEDSYIDYFSNHGIYVAMVCFCDIPLWYVKEHRGLYGAYGIGLKKSWGIQKGLGPIHYVNKNSLFLKQFNRILKDGQKKIETLSRFLLDEIREKRRNDFESVSEQINASMEPSSFFSDLQLLFSYFKPYSGTYTKNGKTYNNYNYSNEKEWRFIPSDDYTGGNHNNKLPYFLPGAVPPENINTWSNGIQSRPTMHLQFEADDVEYIILDTSSDKNDMINFLKTIKTIDNSKLKFSDTEVRALSAKILTTADLDNMS